MKSQVFEPHWTVLVAINRPCSPNGFFYPAIWNQDRNFSIRNSCQGVAWSKLSPFSDHVSSLLAVRPAEEGLASFADLHRVVSVGASNPNDPAYTCRALRSLEIGRNAGLTREASRKLNFGGCLKLTSKAAPFAETPAYFVCVT